MAGLEAPTTRGDFFEAHELLEPAWMGTADLAERDLLQGLIKVAAADVHGVRGNPAGVARNLEGARERLRSGSRAGRSPGIDLDVESLLAAIEARLARRDRASARRSHPIGWRSTMNTGSGHADRSMSRRRSAACARTRTGRSSSTSASARVRRGPRAGRRARADVEFAARIGELPRDRPLMIVCHLRRPLGGGRPDS